MIKKVIESGVPLFGICLGHQMLALALGAKTEKMHHGHRGANHPVKDLQTGKVEITSQNHGFVVLENSLPKGVTVTHTSLFDGSVMSARSTQPRAAGVVVSMSSALVPVLPICGKVKVMI
jgi:carbamoyl-phosphate synthase small subunit